MTSHTRVYLMRHGQVEGFGNKRYNGQADVALTPLGRSQSEQLAARLAERPLAAVYSSDLSRCAYAARCIATARGLEPVLLPEVRELHIGAWEGRTWQELQDLYPDQWQARLSDLVNYRVPGGESLAEMAKRVRPALHALVARHRGEEIVLVGHGGVNRVILLDAIGAPLKQMFAIEQDYACLNLIDYFADGNAVVRLLNG
ncbi:alpha-ribazole phosphatase [Geoalkalibacter sp.]|uniref:alpha-ribazole phosphatase n=1 Tax=Geoalkalibacter sp. TaxID=3041440 RepID=UPI00272DD947|nr:alpha-ribazole phosphatase [Geoalkalibacter sp.]